jgi:putative heme-binding domain-containing protein
LVRRNEPSALVRLRQRLLAATEGQEAIESLWSLYSLAGLDETLAMRLLDSPHRPVRYWTLRYLGDVPAISAAMAERLDELAEQEPDVWVRQQLACTAARLPASQAIPLVNANIIRDIDHQDPYLPWLWWWAVERHSVTGREEVLRRFVRPSAWRSKLGRDFLLPRLVRRYTAEATPAGFDSVARLLQAAPDVDAQDRLWQPILDGWRQANAGDLSRHDLATRIDARWQAVASRDALATYPALAKLAIVCGNRPATERTVAIAVNEKVTAAQRVQALETLAVADVDPLQDVLVNLLKNEPVEAIRLAALELVARIDDASVTTQLIGLLATESSEKLKRRIRGVLLGRPRSALAWLRAVDRGEMAAADAPIDQVRQVAVHNDPRLDQLVRKHWGKLDAATHEQALAEVRRLNNDLRGGDGHAATGRVLFAKHCAGCHQLFGEGKRVGPDLTAANRADSNAMLISLVAPSSVIRKEYSSIIVLTDDGRVLTGVPIQRDAAGVTIVNQMGEQTQIETGDIDSIRESDVSLMPADLYRQLTPQQLRDLFAWLQSKGPVE